LDGKHRRVSVYGTTVEEVRQKVQELQRNPIVSSRSANTTLDNYLQGWLKTIEANYQYKTYELYRGIVNNHISPYMGALKLSKVRPQDVNRLLGTTLAGIGSRVRQQTYVVLHKAFEHAIDENLVSTNPCRKKHKPKHTIAEHKHLSIEEAQRLLETAKAGDYYLLFYLALATGMRQGEIFGLQWDSVSFEGASIYVRATLTKDKDGNPILSPPKASRKRRIDITQNVVSMLRDHKRAQYPLGPWVFADINGEPLRKDYFVRNVFHPLLTKAAIEKIRFHDLRHTSATLSLSNGDNVKIVAERLGHSSPKMTLDTYAHAVPTLQRESAERMDTLLNAIGDTRGDTRASQEA
jgi:integrase